jgi:hypothetical protein
MHNYVLNGQGFGPVGAAFNVTNKLAGGFDLGLLRPFIETDPNSPDRGRPCAQLRTGMIYNNAKGEWLPKYEKRTIEYWRSRGVDSPVFNATVLTRDDWIQIDRAVVEPGRPRLTAWDDLLRSNRISFNAWNKMTFEYNASADSGEAVKSMDATDPGRDDVPLNIARSVPLPVIHADCSLPQRFLDQTSAAGMPIDTTQIRQNTRRMWEMVERTLIGTETGVTYGGRSTGPFPHTGSSTEYGYTNFTYKVAKTDLNAPTGSNPEAVNDDVMEMIETMQGNGFFGPYVLYHSTGYSRFLNSDYFRSGGTSAVSTVRARIMENEDIQAIRRLDYLTSGYQLILVDLGSGHFQAIDGMQPRTIQWSERGGLIQKLCTLMIQVPLLRAPYDGEAALIHATTS